MTTSPSQPYASERVRYEWRNRIEAEYRSAALTQHLTLWLTQIGTSPDLLNAGLRIAGDELVHAELSTEVYCEAGGNELPAIDRDSLLLPQTPEQALEADVVRAGVSVFCLGETVAVPLFRHLRERCTVSCARAALDRILRDEVRHRDFGWDLLDWLLQTPAADQVRLLLQAELPAMLHDIEQSYGLIDGSGEAIEDIDDDDRQWGLAPASEYATILAATIEHDYRPRFTERGIELPASRTT